MARYAFTRQLTSDLNAALRTIERRGIMVEGPREASEAQSRLLRDGLDLYNHFVETSTLLRHRLGLSRAVAQDQGLSLSEWYGRLPLTLDWVMQATLICSAANGLTEAYRRVLGIEHISEGLRALSAMEAAAEMYRDYRTRSR